MIIVRNKISCLVLFMLLCTVSSMSQTLGGSTVFNFLKLPQTPQLTALGGIHISSSNDDLGMAFNNPSLLREEQSAGLSLSFSNFAATKFLNAFGAMHDKKLQTTFGLGVQYLSYGTLSATDAAGNEYGEFRPRDMVLHLSASRKYSDKIHYGFALKFIQSNYGIYRSNGIALDAGIHYADSSGWQASILLKNMGAQLSSYSRSDKSDIPFDIQAGITKKLVHAPIRFSLTIHHLQRMDILYNDTAFNNDNGTSTKDGFFTKAIRHAVLAAQVFPSKNVEISLGYNFLRRSELMIDNSQNGLSGMSFGIGLIFRKFNFRYGRSVYQKNISFNQIGMNLQLSEFMNMKK